MGLPPPTPRDGLQRLIDHGRKTLRRWWLIGAFTALGAGLSLGYAMTRPRSFQSWTTLFYQEQIQSQLLFPGRDDIAQRNLGDRYRELLLARPQLDQIIADPALDPFPGERDPKIKIERLRRAVRLDAHAGVVRIAFTDSDPERARRVLDRLSAMLQDKDEALRKDQARATVAFAIEQRDAARAELRTRQAAFTEFLAAHPEFADDVTPTQGLHGVHRTPAGGNRLDALQHRRQQLLLRLAAPPAVPGLAARSPERIAAEAAVATAQRELEAARRELQAVLDRVTNRHPTAIHAQHQVAAATERLRDAQAALAATATPTAAPPPPPTVDRAPLEAELAQIDAEIRAEQSRSGAPADAAAATSRVIELEGEYSERYRAFAEQRQQAEQLADMAFRAQLDARQKLEQGGRLTVVDPAFEPAQPSGPGRTVLLLAGTILFVFVSVALATGLAVLDDRLYRPTDLDQLGLAVLGVIPPAQRARRPSRTVGP